MKTHVEFKSDAFPPCAGDADMVNEGRWGRRLAEFLADGLKSKGFEPGVPCEEDWGWVLPIRNDDFKLWIGCGNYLEDGFLCFIEPHQTKVRKFLFRVIDTKAVVTALQKAMDEILKAHPAIRDLRWWTYDEFNRPKAEIKRDTR